MNLPQWALAACCSLVLSETYAVQPLAPVIVTAARTAQTADEALAPVIVIPRETIERSQAADVADLLRFRSGIELGRNGGPGQPASLFIRGTDSNHALVMIDGVRINPGTLGGAALQNIDPELVERIEVVKGPLSTLYGSDAIGGVVNIITRRLPPSEQQGGGRIWHAQAGAQTGSFETREVHASLQAAHDRGRLGITGSRLDTEGFPTRQGSNLDRGYDNLSLNTFAGTRLGPLDAELSRWQAQGRVEYLGVLLEPLSQDFENSVTAFTLKAKPLGRWAATLLLSRATDEIDQNQSADFAHTRRNALDWQNDIGLGDHHLLTAGLLLTREHTDSLVFGSGFDVDTDVNAFYVQDNIDYGAHRAQLAWRRTDHESFGQHDTWNLAWGYQATDATRITAGLGTAFRAPDSTDRFGFGGNPDLEPETSRNLELDLRQQLSPHQSLSLNAFRNTIDDLILFTVTGAFPLGRVENVGRARITGLEAEYDGHWERWAARVSALFQEPEDLDTGELLPRRARRSLTASVVYTWSRYQLGADLVAQSRRKDSNFSDESLGGYGLLNLTAQMSPAKGWTLQGRIENVLDKDYELASGFNTPGRSYFLSIRYALE